VLGEGSGEPIQRLGLAEMIYLFRGGDVPNSNHRNPNSSPANAGPSNAGPSRIL
jgi:hypothetical protein